MMPRSRECTADDDTVRRVAEAIVGVYFRQGHVDSDTVADDDIEAARAALIAAAPPEDKA